MSSHPPSSEGSAPSRSKTAISRRKVIGAACLLMSSAIASPKAARAAAKVPQGQAGYRTRPNGAARCQQCVQFLPPAGCGIVDGAISPSGWCNFFAPRSH
jgi:hypothetical protein